ncbi:hypothetical protein D6C92_09404 [Aureobasidium pullulans]|nr:hypothetical protein D6C92_09404 [Aureobasidium pullulans]
MPVCGKLTDVTADFFTIRNGGIREPEYRLPFSILPALFLPGCLIMYGFDCIEDIIGPYPSLDLVSLLTEIVLAAFAFLIAFYTNSWFTSDGPAVVFGTLAGIIFVWFALALPLYVWGKQLRQKSLDWKFVRLIQWGLDHETGE